MPKFYFIFLHVAGPMVDSNMTFSMLSSRDAESNIKYSLSFNVSFGPPSRIYCTRNNVVLFYSRGPHSQLTREVIRSRYIDSTLPDMTHVTIRPDPQSREEATYFCQVIVESRVNIDNGKYDFYMKGSGVSTVTVISECILLHDKWILFSSVASPPTSVKVSRTGFNSVRVSWSAPSSVPAGYEVFYQVDGGSTLSGGNTSNTELTLTGLTLGTHSLFVVGYGAEGAPVLTVTQLQSLSVRYKIH